MAWGDFNLCHRQDDQSFDKRSPQKKPRGADSTLEHQQLPQSNFPSSTELVLQCSMHSVQTMLNSVHLSKNWKWNDIKKNCTCICIWVGAPSYSITNNCIKWKQQMGSESKIKAKILCSHAANCHWFSKAITDRKQSQRYSRRDSSLYPHMARSIPTKPYSIMMLQSLSESVFINRRIRSYLLLSKYSVTKKSVNVLWREAKSFPSYLFSVEWEEAIL